MMLISNVLIHSVNDMGVVSDGKMSFNDHIHRTGNEIHSDTQDFTSVIG